MGYKLLGMAVWHGGRWYLRRRVGRASLRRRLLLAGGVVGFAAATGLLISQRRTATAA